MSMDVDPAVGADFVLRHGVCEDQGGRNRMEDEALAETNLAERFSSQYSDAIPSPSGLYAVGQHFVPKVPPVPSLAVSPTGPSLGRCLTATAATAAPSSSRQTC